MSDKCPMDGKELDTTMKCSTCGREWEWKGIAGEKYLTSKRRRVKIVAPLVEGVHIDDCIKPVD